jgi:8-oxo-dGTP pyrophosphatase MutT (NUDIX family)
MADEIECIASREAYANRWMRVREDQVRRADGSEGLFGIVEKDDFAVVVAVQDGQVAMVEQLRYSVGRRFWEFPQGTVQGASDPLMQARSELREETGLVAETVTHVGKLYLAYGFCTQAYDVFFATGLTQGERQLDSEEQGLVSSFIPIGELERRIADGVIVDATTVASFSLLRLKGLI